MTEKKVLGKSLKCLYEENHKEDIRGLNFKKINNKINLYVHDSKDKKYHIINR